MYMYMYMCVMYVVVVYQVGEGAPIPFWLACSIHNQNLQFDNKKHAIYTIKYDIKNIKGIQNNHFDARPLRLCI